jgi:heme oxygenase
MASSSTVTATTPPLSQRINDATKDVHEKSGNSINWKLSLILTSKECYCEAISLFWIVYREIERLYEKHKNDHKILQLLQPVAVVFRRAPKAEQDIRCLMSSLEQAQELLDRRCPGEGKYDPSALQDYVDRLERIAAENPGKNIVERNHAYDDNATETTVCLIHPIFLLSFQSNWWHICMP